MFAGFSDSCDVAIVLPLFSHPFFEDNNVQIELANYSRTVSDHKPARIRKILHLIWPEVLRDDFFGHFERFENLLIAIGERDHFLHQFNVFLLGFNFIDLLQKDTKTEDKKRVFGTENDDEIHWSWLFAGSAHDLGYPVQKAKNINNELSGLYKNFRLKSLSDFYKLGVTNPRLSNDDSFFKIPMKKPTFPHLISEDFNVRELLLEEVRHTIDIDKKEIGDLFRRQQKKVDHGYLGAVILARNVLIRVLRSHKNKLHLLENNPIFKALLPALGAIFAHNLKKDGQWYYEIKAENNLFAFLLCLMDQVQEWDRSKRMDAKWPESILSKFERDDTQRSIFIEYNLFHREWPQDVIDRTQKSINEKNTLIKSLEPAQPFLDISLVLKYESSCDQVNREFKFNF